MTLKSRSRVTQGHWKRTSVVVVRSKAINYLHLVAVVLRDADND